MFDKIIPYEKNLFLAINGAHTNLLDNMLWLFSSMSIWILPALFLILNIIYKKSWKQWLPVLLGIVLVFILCDQLSSHIIKPLVARPRPTHYPEIMEHVRTLFGYTGGQYGFISGHATNSFGFAMFTALLFRNRLFTITIFIWAFIVAYSRIYLGVHFISDIVGGVIAGITMGFLVYKGYIYITSKIQVNAISQYNIEYSDKQIDTMTIFIILYILSFAALSKYIILFLQ
jgi:undecaprenyl-diphosphatase